MIFTNIFVDLICSSRAGPFTYTIFRCIFHFCVGFLPHIVSASDIFYLFIYLFIYLSTRTKCSSRGFQFGCFDVRRLGSSILCPVYGHILHGSSHIVTHHIVTRIIGHTIYCYVYPRILLSTPVFSCTPLYTPINPCILMYTHVYSCKPQVLVVQRLDNAIHRISPYPVDKC